MGLKEVGCVVFDDTCIVMITDRDLFNEMVGRIGDGMLRTPVDNDMKLPVVSVDRLWDYLVEQTDLLVVHDPAFWLGVPEWVW
jgi:hypothetical protein